MSFRYFLIALFLYCSISALNAQINPGLAVLPLQGNGILPSEAIVLTDELRTVIVQSGTYTVVERNNMESILAEQGFQLSGCTSSECAVEAGKLLGVNKMVTGSVGKLGELYNLSVMLFDVESGKIELNMSQQHEGAVEGLLEVIRKLGYQLTRNETSTSPTAESGPGNGQTSFESRGSRMGIWLGFNFPKTSTISNASGGLAAGILYKALLFKALYLQPEVSYAGSEMEYYEPDDILTFQFLQIAALLSYEISSSSFKDFFFNISAGPALNLILSAEENYFGYIADIKSEVNNSQMIGVVGIGFGFSAAKFVITLDGRYQAGFDPLFINDTDWEIGKLQSFLVLLGLSF